MVFHRMSWKDMFSDDDWWKGKKPQKLDLNKYGKRWNRMNFQKIKCSSPWMNVIYSNKICYNFYKVPRNLYFIIRMYCKVCWCSQPTLSGINSNIISNAKWKIPTRMWPRNYEEIEVHTIIVFHKNHLDSFRRIQNPDYEN